MAHEDYKEIRREGDKRFMECGCVWVGHSCTMDNMCEEGRGTAQAIKNFLTDTPEGRARVKEVYQKSKDNGGHFVA